MNNDKLLGPDNLVNEITTKENIESAGKEKSQDERNTENNAKNINNAANVAIKSGVPVAAAVGAAVKGADKITGGKITKVAGKLFTEFNKMVPLGDKLQGVSNQISESGVSDAIGAIAAVDKGEKVQKHWKKRILKRQMFL